MNLSPEQQAVVDAWGRGVAVMAGAGSGKTTTLVLKCIELLRKKPTARFAAVSFTERSASDLKAKLAEKIGPLAGHWVMTIHGLSSAIIREFPREAGCDGGETMLSASEALGTWERAIQSLWLDALPAPIREAIDHLLADESQASVISLLERVRELAGFGALQRLAEASDLRSQMLARLSTYVLGRYDQMKRRAGQLDFSDLETFALRALANEGVRRSFRERFALVLVDEFQDTNPVQAAIIRAFCREDLSNLCVVGDPKQSIYRFRDADVSLFEEFCAGLPERHSLTWNFRSRPGILDYTNALCGRAFPESGLVYEALVPKLEANPDFDPVLRLEIEEPGDLAHWILAESARGVALSEMALLVRRIRGNEKWLKALSSAGIPIAVGSGGLFWEDPRVRELVAFLRWWEDPANALSGAVFLRAPWVGVSDLEIDRWIQTDPTLLRAFLESDYPLAKALKPWRGKTARPAELLSLLMLSPEIEAELGVSFLGVWHRAEELSLKGLSFREVVHEFTQARDEKRRERDVPPPKNQGQLSVLTLHSSKGLEFRHVILIDFGGKRRAPNAPLLFWDRKQGAFLARRDSEGERDAKDPMESHWRADEKSKSLAESKRLFYVALTRAQERLILVTPVKELPAEPAKGKRATKSSKKEELSAFLTDDWCAWLDDGPKPSRFLKASEIEKVSTEIPRSPPVLPIQSRVNALVQKLQRPRHSVTEWNTLSICPRRYEWTFIRPHVAEQAQAQNLFRPNAFREDTSGLSRRELGSRVHACLERGDYEGLKALETEAGPGRLNADSVIEWAKTSPWMDTAGGEVWSELPFEIQVGCEILVGSVDRIVLRDRLAIIDFKVTEKPKTTDAWLETYHTQLELYAMAVGVLLRGGLHSQAQPSAHAAIPTEAWIVNISPQGVESIRVPLEEDAKLRVKLEALAQQSAEIVRGGAGVPRPSQLCGICEFKSQCPEALQTN
jgi:ATP-dependent exoDNAse (exonuclease V) beta subunit